MNDAFQPFMASNPENESINLWSISRHRPTHLESGAVKFKYKFNKGYFAFQKSLFFSLVCHCLNLKSHQNLSGPIKMYEKLPIWNYFHCKNYCSSTKSKLFSIALFPRYVPKPVKVWWLLGNYPLRKKRLYVLSSVLFWSALLVCDWLK